MASWFPRWLGGGQTPAPPRPIIRRRRITRRPDAAPRRPRESWLEVEARESIDANARTAPRLTGARSWVYQLQSINWERIEATLADVAVVDYSADGSDAMAFSPAQVARMRSKPGLAGETKVICYMSIGEAETYRFYWDRAWAKRRPSWLSAENPEWEGNYKVAYWDRRWQSILLDGPNSYLGKILAAGFDGVYLDIVDGFEYWRDRGRKDADLEMIELVARIGARAWQTNPDFLVIPQNGEELLGSARFRRSISAIAKEDVLFRPDPRREGVDAVVENDDAVIAGVLDDLMLGQIEGIPVLAIEYLRDWPEDEARIPEIAAKLRGLDFIPYFSVRRLDRLSPPVVPPGPTGV